MDATGRLTYRLPNRDKKESFPPPVPRDWNAASRVSTQPVYGAHLLCLIAPQIYTQNCGFSLTQRLILCLIGRDKWKVGKPGAVGQRRPGDHFHFRKQEKQQRTAHTGGPGSGSGQPCPQTTGRANLVHVLKTPLESLCLQLLKQKTVSR